jgi:hypothetical protein
VSGRDGSQNRVPPRVRGFDQKTMEHTSQVTLFECIFLASQICLMWRQPQTALHGALVSRLILTVPRPLPPVTYSIPLEAELARLQVFADRICTNRAKPIKGLASTK